MKLGNIAKSVSVVAVAMAFSAPASFAHFYTSGANTVSPLHSAWPTNFSDTSVIYKLAIIGGQQEAARVLDGQAPTELFFAAKDAAEQLFNVKYASDQEAALEIIQAAEQFSKN